MVRARVLMLMVGAEAEIEILGRCEGGEGGDRREVDLVMESRPGDAADNPARPASLRDSARRVVGAGTSISGPALPPQPDAVNSS